MLTEDCLNLYLGQRTPSFDGARHIVIATDGVFSMDGTIAKLDEIVQLKLKYDALLMVDDCHATGFLGAGGRGSAAFCGVEA